MPLGDRTGPWGAGWGTGRAAGYCAGYPVPGYSNRGFGRGFARGYGRAYGGGLGMAWGWGRGGWWTDYPVFPDAPNETQYLKNMLKALENQTTTVRKRLDELSKPEKD